MPPEVRGTGLAALFERSKITLDATYYGRARRGKETAASNQYYGDINVNVLGVGAAFSSGYAWDTVGFDLSGFSNTGKERGQSELLNNGNYSRVDENGLVRGQSYSILNQAALKLKLGDSALGMEARGGYTPIRIGTMGTSGGLHTHSYRGFEVKGFYSGFELGYGWADQFHNEWDNQFREITNRWDQGRSDNPVKAGVISYVHSVGGRYTFGPDKAAFVDIGMGEGKNFRRNAQIAASYPVKIDNVGTVTNTGYIFLGKYLEKLGSGYIVGNKAATEYHTSFSSELATKDWSTVIAYGYTYAPDSWEQQFRMSAWANSDNRNFIQTWAQVDDFVWDGQSVIKLGGTYKIGKLVNLPGLEVGTNLFYTWGLRNRDGPSAGKKGNGREIDFRLTYTVPDGALKGLSAGVYTGNLSYSDFDGKNDRTDVKVIVGYSYTFDTMQYLMRKNK